MPGYNLHSYPADLGDAVQVVIDAVRGEPVPKVEYAHAGWHVVGFALSKVDHAHTAGEANKGYCFDMKGQGCYSDKELVAELEKLNQSGGVKAISLDWLKIARTILCLLFDLCPV